MHRVFASVFMHIAGVWVRDVRMENRQGLMHEALADEQRPKMLESFILAISGYVSYVATFVIY
jgi:hypothetical protein